MEALEGGWTSLAWQCAGLCSTTLGSSYHYGALTSRDTRARVKMRTGIMLTGVTAAAGDNHPLARRLLTSGDQEIAAPPPPSPMPPLLTSTVTHRDIYPEEFRSEMKQIFREFCNIFELIEFQSMLNFIPKLK